MKTRLLKIINNFNESLLALGFVTILFFSLIVAQSIKVNNLSNKNILGTSDSKKEFVLNENYSPLYNIEFTQMPFQLSFEIMLNPMGSKNFNILLGKVNSIVQGGLVYRSALTIPEIYKNDFKISIIISGKSYPLLDGDKSYINEIKIPYGNDIEVSLDFISEKEIYYKENIKLNLYK